MHYQFVPYLWLSITLTAIMLVLFLFSWKRRAVRCVPYLLCTLALVTVWIIAQALEIAAVELPVKVFWANVQFTPILLTPVSYLCLTLHFMGYEQWLRKRWLSLILLIMPLLCNLLIWTNDYHGLMKQDIHLDLSGPFPVIAKTYEPLFWVFSIYNFAVSIFTLLVLIKGMNRKAKQQRVQVVAIFMGLLLPVCSVGLYVTKLIVTRVDLTPAFIGLSALIIGWGIFRYRLFDIVPIAHSMIIREMSTGMILFDKEGGILEVNPAACELLNIPSKQLSGLTVESLQETFPHLVQLYGKQSDMTQEVVIKSNENVKYCEVSLKRLEHPSNNPLGWIMQIYDITTRKIEEEHIRLAASHDALTGLLNRVHFKALFSEKFTHAQNTGTALAVAYLDLDDFKQVNDHYGHDVGDIFLCEVANRLKSVLYESDVIARFGGDEYVILFPSVGDDERLATISNKIFQAFEKRVEYNGFSLQIRASIGFSVYPRDGDSMDILIKKADKAMYEIKESKKNSSLIYKA